MKLSYTRKRNLSGYLFASPWLFGAIFLLVYPFLFSLSLSFSTMQDNNFQKMSFAGLINYKTAFITDVEFLPKLLESIVDTVVNTPMIVIVSTLLAVFISRGLKGQGVFRVLFFLPVLLGTGFVMSILQGEGIHENTMQMARNALLPSVVQEYIGPTIMGYIDAFFSRITMVLWSSGVQIIFMLAGLNSISPYLYEVARVDGATEWEIFWKVTLPMTAPFMLLNMVYTIVMSFTNSSSMVDYILYRTFQATFPIVPDFAYGAAMGWIYFIFILLVILLVFLVMRPAVKRVSE